MLDIRDFGADPTGSLDSTTAIQNALNQGGIIYVPAGIFIVSSPLILISQTILTGIGRLVLADNSNNAILSIVGVTEIKIHNISLDGNRLNQTISEKGLINCVWANSVYIHNIEISGVTVENGIDFGINLDHAAMIDITGCKVMNCNKGINSSYSNELIINGNYIDGFSANEQGIEIWGGGIEAVANDSFRHVISNNIVKNVTQGGIWGAHFEGVSITGNYVENCGDVGIDAENAINVTITGNTVKNCLFGGITTFYNSSFINISSNLVSQQAGKGPGIYLKGIGSNFNISCNNIHTVDSYGIKTDLGSFSNSLIGNNNIVCEQAIAMRLLESDKIEIVNNNITVGSAPNFPVNTGINIEGGSEYLVSGNKIESLLDDSSSFPSTSDQGGIHIYWRSADEPGQRNTVVNNVIKGFEVSINDNCWGDPLSQNLITNNRVSKIAYRASSGGYQGWIGDNRDIINPTTIVNGTLY